MICVCCDTTSGLQVLRDVKHFVKDYHIERDLAAQGDANGLPSCQLS